MKVNVTSRHQDIEAKAREYAVDRMQRVLRLYERLDDANVIVDHEHEAWIVEGTVKAPKGGPFVAKAEGADLRAVIDAMGQKLEAQVRQWKDRLTDHRPPHGSPGVPGASDGSGS